MVVVADGVRQGQSFVHAVMPYHVFWLVPERPFSVVNHVANHLPVRMMATSRTTPVDSYVRSPTVQRTVGILIMRVVVLEPTIRFG